MITLTYDHSFEGLLTAIFEVYAMKYGEVNIQPSDAVQNSLFGEAIDVSTRADRAGRVWSGLETHVSKTALTAVWRAFLSELPGVEDMILQYIRYALSRRESIEHDFSHAAVRYIMDTAKKVHREKHRMEAFVRFKLSADGLYLAEIDPDYNVLPLIREHFEKRYADQRWMIVDQRRQYGLYYDLETVEAVTFGELSVQATVQATDPANEPPVAALLDETEIKFQQLWAHYFQHINIKERRNMKLHIQHMPRRYWKYLPEKDPGYYKR